MRRKILQARHRHLRNRRRFSVACSDGSSVAFSKYVSLVRGIFQRIVTFSVNCTGNVQWMFSGIFPWNYMFVISVVIFCPEDGCPVRFGHLPFPGVPFRRFGTTLVLLFVLVSGIHL